MLYEIAERKLPYEKERISNKKSGRKGMDMRLMRSIASGDKRPELNPLACRKYGVPRLFKNSKVWDGVGMGGARGGFCTHSLLPPYPPPVHHPQSSSTASSTSRDSAPP